MGVDCNPGLKMHYQFCAIENGSSFSNLTIILQILSAFAEMVAEKL